MRGAYRDFFFIFLPWLCTWSSPWPWAWVFELVPYLDSWIWPWSWPTTWPFYIVFYVPSWPCNLLQRARPLTFLHNFSYIPLHWLWPMTWPWHSPWVWWWTRPWPRLWPWSLPNLDLGIENDTDLDQKFPLQSFAGSNVSLLCPSGSLDVPQGLTHQPNITHCQVEKGFKSKLLKKKWKHLTSWSLNWVNIAYIVPRKLRFAIMLPNAFFPNCEDTKSSA